MRTSRERDRRNATFGHEVALQTSQWCMHLCTANRLLFLCFLLMITFSGAFVSTGRRYGIRLNSKSTNVHGHSEVSIASDADTLTTSMRSEARPTAVEGYTEEDMSQLKIRRDTMAEIKVYRGTPHTAESKAKISAANKGKVPWNAGKKHSEETKKKIAEKTREAMLKRKIGTAKKLGMTLEEYNKRKQSEKKEKKAAKPRTGLTEDGRRRISESLKRRWRDPEYRKKVIGTSHRYRDVANTPSYFHDCCTSFSYYLSVYYHFKFLCVTIATIVTVIIVTVSLYYH